MTGGVDMSIELLKTLVPVMIFFAGIVWALLINHNKKITDAISQLRQDMHDIQLDMAKHYITRDEYDKETAGNSASHATIWGELNQVKERITKVETVQEHCNNCKGVK